MVRLRTGQPGIESRKGQEIFLFSKMFRPTLYPTKPPIPWTLDPFSGEKGGHDKLDILEAQISI